MAQLRYTSGGDTPDSADTAATAGTTIIRELPSEMRPREELERRGAVNVQDEVLLAILLRTGRRGQNVIDLARTLLIRTGGLKALAKLTYQEIRALGIGGIGRVKAMELAAALEIGRRAADQAPTAEMPLVNDPETVYQLLEPRTRAMRTEVFWVLPLNSKNRLIDHPFDASKGTADSSPANPRDVLSPAVRVNAVSIIVAHNHPSGDPTPSSADIRVTRQIVEAGRLLGLRILDHVIIGQPAQNRAGYLSIRQQGLVQFE